MALSPLVVNDLTYSYPDRPDRPVLTGVSFTVPPGSRLGIVGENGSGKSTLLRLIAEAHPSAGYLAQDSGLDPRMPLGAVLQQALAPLHGLVRTVERLAEAAPTSSSFAAALEQAVDLDAWDADRRAEEAAARLGLGAIDPARLVGELSGGQRGRLALAVLLVRRPETLLLDEPTNHLDDQGLDYLESELLTLPGVLVGASHDRVFLDRVVTSLYDLDPTHFGTDGEGGRLFGGGYSSYLVDKRAERERWEQAYAAQRNEIAIWEAKTREDESSVAHNRGPRDNDKFIYTFKRHNVQRTVARRSRDAERRLAALRDNEIRKPRPPLQFVGLADVTGASVRVRDLVVRGRLRLQRLDVAPGEHWLITGPNGSGKSTLLSVLAGTLPADGIADVHARRIGHLPQDDYFADPSLSPTQIFESACSTGTFKGSLADLGLVHPRDAHRPVGASSLGQQRRLALACVIARSPDLLLLDEPTNHLSLTLVEELQSAVGIAKSTVIVTSHDRWWRRSWTGSHCAL